MPHSADFDQSAPPTKGHITSLAIAGAAIGALALFSHLTARRIEAQIPADGQFIDAGGTRLHYRDVGTARPGARAIVMIHGLGGQMRNFSYALLGRLEGHRVILVDRPGSGYSSPIAASRANVRAQAGVMAAFIDALGLDRAPLVVGHSLGGAIALALALDHPGHVGGLTLLAPLTQPVVVLPDVFKRVAAVSAPLRRALSWTLATPVGMLTRDAALRSVFAPEAVAPDFGTRGGGRLAVRPGNFHAASGDMLAANNDMADMAKRYGEVKVPVGILYARGDRVLDPEAHGVRTARDVPGFDLELIDGGHMFPVTQPETTARWISERMDAVQQFYSCETKLDELNRLA